MDPNEMVKQVKALKARNKELEDALTAASNALRGSQEQEQPPIIIEEKVPYNRVRIKGMSYYGKRGKNCVYQCDGCKQIGESRTIKKHTDCRAKLEKEKKKTKTKTKGKKEKKLRRKEKVITGFTLSPSKKGGSIFYECVHCHLRLLETSTAGHNCRSDRPVPITMDALIMDDTLTFTEEEKEKEEDRSDPLYKGQILGWSWHSYNNGYSLYQCEGCHISMRHDYVHMHQCRQTQLRLNHPNNDDMVFVL